MRRAALFVVSVACFVMSVACASEPRASSSTAATSTTVPVFTGSSGSEYCDLVRRVATLVPNLSGDLKAAFQAFDSFAVQLTALAPAPIKADAEVMVRGVRQLEAAVVAANYDLTKLAPSSDAGVQDPKFSVAINRIDAYDIQVCRVATPTTT